MRVCIFWSKQTLQEQQAIHSQKLEELHTWTNQALDRLTDSQGTAGEGDLSTLEKRQSDVKVAFFDDDVAFSVRKMFCKKFRYFQAWLAQFLPVPEPSNTTVP